MVDVLSFVDEPYENPLDDGRMENRRQLAVNGIAIATQLSRAYGHEVHAGSPLVDGVTSVDEDRQYLRGLRGDPVESLLRSGRVGIAFCSVCLDGSCGELAAASLTIAEHTVSWSQLGFERENFGEYEKRFGGLLGYFRARVVPPPEWWTPDPVDPPLGFTFDRADYVATIDAELDRSAGNSSES